MAFNCRKTLASIAEWFLLKNTQQCWLFGTKWLICISGECVEHRADIHADRHNIETTDRRSELHLSFHYKCNVLLENHGSWHSFGCHLTISPTQTQSQTTCTPSRQLHSLMAVASPAGTWMLQTPHKLLRNSPTNLTRAQCVDPAS